MVNQQANLTHCENDGDVLFNDECHRIIVIVFVIVRHQRVSLYLETTPSIWNCHVRLLVRLPFSLSSDLNKPWL